MNIENYIESQYREMATKINIEYQDLYNFIKHSRLKEILATIHYLLVTNYRIMNERLPTGDNSAHFWAEPSRELYHAIEVSTGLQRALQGSSYAISIDPYYAKVIEDSQEFLRTSGGSEIPPNMDKITLYYTIPIFNGKSTIDIDCHAKKSYELKPVGEGSYANVYKFKDDFYGKWFALKRAKKDLKKKEIERFKREFEQMHEANSPYIVEAYRFNEAKNEYVMELMDCTLHDYIIMNNNNLNNAQRKNIGNQVLKAFQYIHSKNLLHRDISPKNVLLKDYDDIKVVKVADFGLVKIPDSKLTSLNTEFKGYFNDPALQLEGFDSYEIIHETYALTRLLYFILTGKTNTERISDSAYLEFVNKGLSAEKNKRFKSVDELSNTFRQL